MRGCGGVSRKRVNDNAASARRSTPHAAIHTAGLWGREVSSAVGVEAEAPESASSISMRASVASCNRWRRSFRRQRRSSVRMLCGVLSGKAIPVRLGSHHCGKNFRSVLALEMCGVRKSFRNRHEPNAQMSVALVTCPLACSGLI